MGLLKAIRWLSDMGMSNAIFELDCNLVVDRINSFDIDFSKSDSIILQCKNILMQNLINSVKLARLMLVLKKFIIYPHVYFKLWLMKYLDLVFVTKKKSISKCDFKLQTQSCLVHCDPISPQGLGKLMVLLIV